MRKYSKAIGAALGGGMAGTVIGGVVLPDGLPWYAYTAVAIVSIVTPAVAAYFAPKNAER